MSELSAGQPVLALKKEALYKFLIFTFLFIGYLNTILRLNPESNITLFRLLLPLAFISSVLLFKTMMLRCIITLVVFLIYGMVNSIFISRFGQFNVVYFLHYATLIFLAFLTFSAIKRFGIESVYSHLRLVYIVMIGLAILQFFYAYEFPNTLYRNTLNIFYWVENDFSAALAAFIPFLLVAPDKRNTNRILAFTGIAIIIYNGSRIALLGILFFIIFKLLSQFSWKGYFISALGVIIILFLFKDYRLGGNSIYQLLIDPFGHIFTLTPYVQYGSVYDRTNALIFGLRELINTWGFGVGPGNVTAMFEKREYFLRTAQSMHNFVAQIIVEYGWLIVIMVMYAMLRFYNLRRRSGIRIKEDTLLYIYLVSVALASLSQSEGLFSNYYFFVSLFTAIAFFGRSKDESVEYTDSRPE